jgi:uncharacterized protein (DUF58 family)
MPKQFSKVERLYILPTGHGYAVLALNVIFILVAASSGNNAVYILGFVMFAVYLLAMLATHFNLRALEIELVDINDGFAGESAHVTLALTNPSAKPRFLVMTQFRVDPRALHSVKDELPPKARTLVNVNLTRNERGVFSLPALQISSVYPLGLFRTWTRIHLAATFFIYPRREEFISLATTDTGEGTGDFRGGSQDTQHEDFREHKRYEAGESHLHVDWKAFARRGELLTKRFETSAPRHFILEWHRVSHLGLESALSQLSQWIEELRHTDMSFEMRLPGVALAPGRGWNHGQICLRELARYKGNEA